MKMFKSKLEVDRHVSNCLKKINNETERNLRCFSFGKLYFNVGDYDQAYRYVTSYLAVKPKSSEGYLLLGKSLEKLGKLDAALEAYRNSLQIDPKQNNVVIKVCELLSSDNVDLDLSGARYFCDLAQTFDPNNPAVYGLKEKLITKQNENPMKITELLLQELEIRPSDVNLRIRLLKHFIQNNMVLEAYKHASAIEDKHIAAFSKNLSWYENFSDILLRFQKESAASVNNWEFWLLSVSVLERLVALSLEEYHNTIKCTTTEYVTSVFNFDQILYKAHQSSNNFIADRNLISIFFKHYHAQLHFHYATLIYKQAKRDNIEFKEASNFVLPVLFTAYHSNPPDLNSYWFIQSSDNIKRLINRWYETACYRNSQMGHIILTSAKDRKSLLLDKAAQYSSGNWRENLYKKLFIRREQQLKLSSSFFVTNSMAIEPIIKLPNAEDVSKFDEIALLIHPDVLHHYIWIASSTNIPDMSIKTFEGLQYSTTNITNCAAESLNLLDIYAFICCATLCTSAQQRKDSKKIPASITENLATINQSKFLESAYKMYKNDQSSNSSDLRVVLIKGIEVVRCIGHHGLDVKLLVILANIFEERAKKLSQQSEIEFTLARAELYWKAAVPLLEKVINKEAIMYSNNRMFEYKSSKLTVNEAESHLDKGKLFLATQLYKKKDFEKALTLFNKLKDPFASYYQYEIYKHIADQKKRDNKENISSDIVNEYKMLLTKARDCLYLTLDRLREPNYDLSHPLNSKLSTEIGKVERLLSGIESDGINFNNSDSSEENNRSIDTSIGEHYLSAFTSNLTLNTSKQPDAIINTSHSTPLRFNVTRQEVRPSPERLDAQIRQIMTSRDASFSLVSEQNRAIADAQKNLMEKLNFVIDDLKIIKTDIENLKEVTKSVNEIKNTTEDFQNMMDVIQDIRKDLNEVKKNDNKNNQLSEEDLYVLDPDYGVDYNIAASIPANIPGTYPNYPAGRIPNPTHLPAYGPSLMYPGLYPGLPYTYGGLNFAQPGSIPFLSDQQAPGVVPSTSLPAALIQQPPNTKFGLDIRKPQLPSQSIVQSSQPAKEDMAAVSSALNLNNPIKLPIVATSSPLIVPSFGKSPPVNVVITTSDPLPSKNSVISQPVLSVTIPPQHVKSNFSKVGSASTTTVSSNVTGSLFVTSAKPTDFSTSVQNKDKIGANISTTSINSLEDEPNVDFKPVIPLPDEVPVVTGEENETELFCARAKLFRHVNVNGNKEWKERGVGNLKILKNKENGKCRILMRRDQVLKICANHVIQKEMTLIPSQNNDKAFTWIAQDFSEGEIQIETFCVKFKTAEEAQKFSDTVKSVKMSSEDQQKPKSVFEKPAQNLFQSTSSTSLGGFVFTGTPTFKPKEIAPPLIVTPEKPKEIVVTTTSTINSPFATFVFGKSGFKKDEDSKTFSPLVIAQEKKPDDADKDLSPVDEFVPTAEFKPVVPLPELVEVKTGEENCQVLFEARTKLFRYDSNGETKEWKERGVGTIKILKDDFLRLIMRRDQVHKVCCNHRVLKDMIFKPNSGNPKAIVWRAQDFSEEELVPETFTARFKTEELASLFLRTLQNMQKLMDDNNSFAIGKTKKTTKEVKKADVGFGDTFKAKAGSWECEICLIRNDGDAQSCMACDTPKDGVAAVAPKPATNFAFNWNVGDKSAGDAKKVDAGFGDAFKVKAGSWECKTCLIRNDGAAQDCVACDTPRDGSVKQNVASLNKPLSTIENKWSFGIPSAAATTTTPTINLTQTPVISNTNIKPSFTTPTSFFFGSNQMSGSKITSSTLENVVPQEKPSEPKWIFGKPSTPLVAFNTSNLEEPKTPENAKPDAGNVSAGFVFGSNQKEGFEFKQRTPRRISGGPGNEESDGSYVEEEEDNIYFKPIIPLPDIVQVKTGEEEEDLVFSQRSKLFRFVNGEWKERGLGDVKILRNKETNKLRVLMRREQVLKICLNHMLSKEIEYVRKDERSLLFAAADYSEGELVREQFCLRFKNADIANNFLQAVNDALQGTTIANKSIGSTEKSEDDDVVIVSETQVTPEEEQFALKLGLPPKFLSYKQLPDCKCEQCKKDDEYLKDLFASDTSVNTAKNSFSFSPNTGGFLLKPAVLSPANAFAAAAKTTVSDTITKFSFSPATVNLFGSIATTSSDVFSSPAISISTGLFSSPAAKTTVSDTITKFSFSPAKNNLFGSIATTSSDIFSSPAITISTGLFSSPAATSGLFASPTITTTASTIFSSPAVTTSAPPLFTSSITPSSGLFTAGSIGNSFSSNNSIFGNSTSSNFSFGVAANNLFNAPTPAASNTNIFSSLAAKNIAETKAFESVFSGSNISRNIFANSGDKITITELDDNEEPILKCDSGLSFASLAAKAPEEAKPVFTKKTENNSFAFVGAGAPVFGSLKNKSTGTAKADTSQNEDDTEDGQNTEDYDPHYEPIVPLPDQIVVTTGEENEDVLFNERAKLFRFDANTVEWKERGVGQLKILQHREKHTYRLLLRREQVHKIVLNQLITANFELQPMMTSDKAWMWAGYNYTEGENALEKLAVRFKNQQLANQFKVMIDEAIGKVQKKEQQQVVEVPVSVQDFESVGDSASVGVEEVYYKDEYDEEYGEEEDEDEEEERSVMFMKECTLSELQSDNEWQTVGQGDLQVYYDPELYACRIQVTDTEGKLLSHTLIGFNTIMDLDKNECTWKAIEWAENVQWRNLKATFDDEVAAQEFHSNYIESLNYAQQVGLLDELPQEGEVED